MAKNSRFAVVLRLWVLGVVFAYGCSPASSSGPDSVSEVDLEVVEPALVVTPGNVYLMPGGSVHCLVSVVGDQPATGLKVTTSRLTATLGADSVAPGEWVLLRFDAPESLDAGWHGEELTLSGAIGGIPTELQYYVIRADPDAAAPALSVSGVALPPAVAITDGTPATARLYLNPLSRATRGTLRFRPIPDVVFDPPSLELDGQATLTATVTVNPELRYANDVLIDGFLGRSHALHVDFDVTAPPFEIETAPVQLARMEFYDLYLAAGRSATMRWAYGPPELDTQWTFRDLPAGVTATAEQGVFTFSAAEGVAGAFAIGLEGSREGYTHVFPIRLLVGRALGDWPLLGDSPTVKEDRYDGPATTAMAIDAAGDVYVLCATGLDKDLRRFADGAWEQLENLVYGCGTFDGANGRLCQVFVTQNEQLAGECWVPPFKPNTFQSIDYSWSGLEFFSAASQADLVMGFDAYGKAHFLRYEVSVSRWRNAGQLAMPATIAAIAPWPTTGAAFAERVPVDHLSPTGWLVVIEVQVSRVDGTTLTRFEGLDGQIDFPGWGKYVDPALDVEQPVALQVTADEQAVVAWVDSRDDHLHVSRWDGSAWQQLAPPLAASELFFIQSVQLELAPDGTPIIAWLESTFPSRSWNPNDGPSRVRVHRVEATGWVDLAPEGVNIDPTGPATELRLALDASGRPYVAWQEAGYVLVARYAR